MDGTLDGSRRPVRDFMRQHFIALSPGDSLVEAERTMRMARVRALPVLQGRALLGVAAHGALVRELLARLLDAGEGLEEVRRLPLEQLSLQRVATVSPEDPVWRAVEELCSLGVGCLAVVEETPDGVHMVGLLTEADLLRAAYESFLGTTLR